MPAVRTTLWIGSIADMPDQDVNVFGGTTETISGGPMYMWHPSASLSAADLLAAELLNAGATAPVAVELLDTLYFRITVGAVHTINFFDTDLSRALGFTNASYGPGTSFTAEMRSSYIWSAGFPGRLATRAGVSGYPKEDALVRPSADGTEQEIDYFTSHTLQEIDYDVVPLDRYRRSSSSFVTGLTWHEFRQLVLLQNARFQLYEAVTEDPGAASPAPIVLPAPLGTYRVREIPKGTTSRKIPRADTYWRVDAKLRVVPEYGA